MLRSVGIATTVGDRRDSRTGVRCPVIFIGKLMVELVPRSTWGWNLRSELTRTQWDRLRKATYARAGNRCEVCGGKGRKHPVECHERWEYDDVNHVQKLVGLEALCPYCHEVRHIGRAMNEGNGERAMIHLDRVNNWSSEQTTKHVAEAMQVWHERSKHEWTLDLSWLNDAKD
jgi:hypothetical protein